MRIEFTSQSGRDGLNPAAQTGRLLNLFREPLVPGGKGQYQLRSVPGMLAFASVPRVFMRDMRVFRGNLAVLCGGTLSSITSAGVVSDVLTLPDSVSAGLAENTGYLTACVNGDYRVWNGTAVSSPSTGAITEVGSVSTLGGYTILTELGGRRLQWSALADPTTFSGLDFASAETTEAPIVRGVPLRDQLMVFKERTLEQWTRTGLAGPDAFVRIPGADVEVGLGGYHLVANVPNGLAFIGSDGRAYLWFDGPQPISTPTVEVAIREYEPQSILFYELLGHGMICLTFRTGTAWCYDIATAEWHERAEGEALPWTAAKSVQWGGAWYVGTTAGRIARLSSRLLDFGAPLIRKAVSLPVAQRGNFRVSRIELFPVVGMHRQDGDISTLEDDEEALYEGSYPLGDGGAEMGPARIELRASRDGIIFGEGKIRDLGEAGEYGRRITWRNLGLFRGVAAFEVRVTSKTDVPFLSAAEVDVA